MKLYKSWPFHLIIRLIVFPAVAILIYYILARGSSAGPTESWKVSFFGAAAISCLSLMAESILLFQKQKMKKLYCNLATILCVVLFIIFFVPAL